MSNSFLLWQLSATIQNFFEIIYKASSPCIGFVWYDAAAINQGEPFTFGDFLFLLLSAL